MRCGFSESWFYEFMVCVYACQWLLFAIMNQYLSYFVFVLLDQLSMSFNVEQEMRGH